MKTVGTAPGGGAAALVGFPTKSSKCKLSLPGEQNHVVGLPLGDFYVRYVVVSPVTEY